MRTIIDIPEGQKKSIISLSKQKKVSMAEIIRQAISQYLSQFTEIRDANDCYGIWKNRQISSKKYQENIRKDWNL